MQIKTRVWSVGKVLLLVGAVVSTFFLFAGISMRVALRAREVQVPDLRGHDVKDASQSLAEIGLGLRVDDIRRPDARVPAGRIMQQDPFAGVQARRQRTIRVWLSAGVASTTVPALVGQTERTARIRLRRNVLRASGSIRTASRSRRLPSSARPSIRPMSSLRRSRRL